MRLAEEKRSQPLSVTLGFFLGWSLFSHISFPRVIERMKLFCLHKSQTWLIRRVGASAGRHRAPRAVRAVPTVHWGAAEGDRRVLSRHGSRRQGFQKRSSSSPEFAWNCEVDACPRACLVPHSRPVVLAAVPAQGIRLPAPGVEWHCGAGGMEELFLSSQDVEPEPRRSTSRQWRSSK